LLLFFQLFYIIDSASVPIKYPAQSSFKLGQNGKLCFIDYWIFTPKH